MIIGVMVGSFTIIWLTVKGDLGGEIFGIYMACTGGVYSVTKWRESAVEMQQIRSDIQPPEEPEYKPKRKPKCSKS